MDKNRQLVLLSCAPDSTILVPYALYPSRQLLTTALFSKVLRHHGDDICAPAKQARRTPPSRNNWFLCLAVSHTSPPYGNVVDCSMRRPRSSQAGRSHMQGVSSQSGKALVLPQTIHLHTSRLSGPSTPSLSPSSPPSPVSSLSLCFYPSVSL